MSQAEDAWLPNASRARVDRSKVVEYLLSTTHPRGAHKARSFQAVGFSAADWDALRQALLDQARTQPVISIVESPMGTRYTVEGPIESPKGRPVWVRTVWILEEGSEVPRLVTAFPGRRRP